MGCNPSKESQVATGNTVGTRGLEKKPSDVIKEAKIEEPDEGREVEDVAENVEVKDVQENTTNGDVEEQGKFIEADSPGPRLLSGKEEEAVHGVATSVELSSETAEGPKIEEVEMAAAVEVENGVPLGEVEENRGRLAEEPGSVYGSADLTGTNFSEELNEPEAITTP